MSMQDPISDMLTRVRNGQAASKVRVQMPYSKQKEAMAKVLKDQGYIRDYGEEDQDGHRQLAVGNAVGDHGSPVAVNLAGEVDGQFHEAS